KYLAGRKHSRFRELFYEKKRNAGADWRSPGRMAVIESIRICFTAPTLDQARRTLRGWISDAAAGAMVALQPARHHSRDRAGPDRAARPGWHTDALGGGRAGLFPAIAAGTDARVAMVAAGSAA